MRRGLAVLLVALSIVSTAMADGGQWPQWQAFKQDFVVAGRVVDDIDARRITTSEGQAYGLFFALLANDRATFAELLNWTEQHLADGDLTATLPAWRWGRAADGVDRVLDANPASDADLWMAYSLAEAGRLWSQPYYSSLAYALAARVLREEVAVIAPYGKVLLPAPHGFALADGGYRINPSYMPLQILERFAELYPHGGWPDVAASSALLLRQLAPRGWFPDWAALSAEGVNDDPQSADRGSYDAIRNYLWLGMLADDHPAKPDFLLSQAPLLQWLAQHPSPPLRVRAGSGEAAGQGPYGFSAAVLPLLRSVAAEEPLQLQLQQVQRQLAASNGSGQYYNRVLSLFGLGWLQNCYRFSRHGALLPQWQERCE